MATILFLAHRIPYPPNKGDKLRAYQVLNHWTKQHKVFLGCFIDDPEDLQHRDLLRERCAGAYFARLHPKLALVRASGAFLTNDPLSLPYYRDRGLATWVRRVMATEKPDCAFVYSSVMAQYSRRGFPAIARPRRLCRCRFRKVGRIRGDEDVSRPTNLSPRGATVASVRSPRRQHKLTPVSSSRKQKLRLFRKLAPEVREKVFAIPNGIDSTYFLARECWPEAELRWRARYCVHRPDGLLAERRCRGLVQRHRATKAAA